MDKEGWFADTDDEMTGDFKWQPVLQEGCCCFPLPVWFPSEQACEQYIREKILGKGMLD